MVECGSVGGEEYYDFKYKIYMRFLKHALISAASFYVIFQVLFFWLAGSHGHLQFRVNKGEDWLFFITMSILIFVFIKNFITLIKLIIYRIYK